MEFTLADRQLLAAFADLLAYPTPELPDRLEAVAVRCARLSPAAAAALDPFRNLVARTSPNQLEEIYSGTFDLNAALHPYVGYHLFGESYKRSAFLLGLEERYQAAGFAHDKEIPDHLGVMLRFAAGPAPQDEAEILLREAIIPVLARLAREQQPDAELRPLAEEGVPTPACAPLCAEQPPQMRDGDLPVPVSARQRAGTQAYRSVLRALEAFLLALVARDLLGASMAGV